MSAATEKIFLNLMNFRISLKRFLGLSTHDCTDPATCTYEIPNRSTLRQLKKSERDVKAGRVYSFQNGEDAVKFLATLRNK